MSFRIHDRPIGDEHPTYVIAELSANHAQRLDRALELVSIAASCGADAVKIQTYTADTLTIDSDAPAFRIGPGSPWAGQTLYELYEHATTPWEWTEPLMERADDEGIALFSTPFDPSAVDFLDALDTPAFKIASFELVDTDLIEYAAAKGRPLIMSTGMATRVEIVRAVEAAEDATGLGLLRCSSAYPSPPEALNLRTIRDMRQSFDAVIGLSDHTLTAVAPVAAVALGARIVEKHLTRRRSDGGPDASFSLEPPEFAEMVESVRTTERVLGEVSYGPTDHEINSRALRRSLFAVADIPAGTRFDETNVRSIRPGDGLPPHELRNILGRRAARDLVRGQPLAWDDIDDQ